VQMTELAGEIRKLIVETTARTGGHTAPSLGVVELTIALHYVFDTPQDQVIWDVGHQSYAHKIITGRRDRFATLRQQDGIAGFPKREESEYDNFDTGHAGDSIGAALGIAVGDRLRGRNRKSIAVVGDGSVVAGMAFEALNHGGCLKQDLVVILNDNEMSIAKSTGAMAGYLNRIITGRMYNQMKADIWNLLGHLPKEMSGTSRQAARKLEEGIKNLVAPSILFEELGFRYIGPVNGHSLPELIETFQRVKRLHGPILIHAVTRKGQGYAPALARPERFHGTGPFDVATGDPRPSAGPTFTGTFGSTMLTLAEADERVAAVTAGMCLGTGLSGFREKFPNRFFDVGICEQHAVTFGAGLAQAGMRPVVALYSTFMCRAIDQLTQDVCLQNLPVVFAVDRAGLVGEDGPTHHGIFDLTYLTMVPRLRVLAPMDETELAAMIEFAVHQTDSPVAIRYPRGGSGLAPRQSIPPIETGRAERLRDGKSGCVFAIGSMVGPALRAADDLDLAVINARWAKPIDTECIAQVAAAHRAIVTVEENVLAGGFGTAVEQALEAAGYRGRLLRIGLPDAFVEQAPRARLLGSVGLDSAGLAERFRAFFA
jgi:1-deoxy-D-xylulose-5-phosphate synthase